MQSKDDGIKAFVFGKFMPFHTGHEQLINFALQHCAHLTVLVCSSDQEEIPGCVRLAWLQETYAHKVGIDSKLFEYNESELPNTSETTLAVATAWSNQFQLWFSDYSLVVTSEPYGALVAAHLGIRHLQFDLARKIVPISASIIRQNPRAYWHFLPNSVKPYYVQKAVILGTESTGKTTLVNQLAAHFKASLVLEAGRDLIPSSQRFTLSDLQAVATEHARRIKKAQTGFSPLVIIDTDIHITQSYARFVLGKDVVVTPEVYALNRADLYLYLAADVPFVQDGTRISSDDRLLLDISHRQTLRHYGITAIEISGSWLQRFQQAVKLIESLI